MQHVEPSVANSAKKGISQKGDEIVNKAQSQLQKMEDSFSNVRSEFNNKLHDAQDYLKNTDVKSAFSDMRSLMKRHPVVSAGIGIGLGFLVGKALNRR